MGPHLIYATTGTNQASVPLAATFDATSFSEGYTLVVMMKVWDTQGNVYDARLSAPVHLPTLAAYVIWTPDDTLPAPVPQAATQSGQIGGNATVHVSLLYPPGGSSASLDSLTIHEAFGDTADLVTTNAPMTGAANPLCGDPDPAWTNPPPACYLDVPWGIGAHNGNYALTPLLTWTGKASMAPGAASVTRRLSSAITVDREDLLIASTSPANPTPLKWDPSANNGNPAPLTVSATITAAYKAGGTATLNIYDTQQNLIRTLTQPFTTTDGQVTFSWDGKADGPKDGQGNPVLDTSGNPVPGPMQPLDIYLFKFSLSDSNGNSDCDKSTRVNVSASANDALLTDDGTTATFQTNYTLASIDNPARSGSQGEFDIYSGLEKISTSPLGALDLTPGSHLGSKSLPSPESEGRYKFIVCLRDNDADSDKGHRLRYALQHNNAADFENIAIAFGHDDTGNHASVFSNYMKALGYKHFNHQIDATHVLNSYYYAGGSINVPLIRGALEYIYGGKKTLRAVMFTGHAWLDGMNILLRGVPGTTSDGTIIVATKAWHANPANHLNHVTGLDLDTVNPRDATTGISLPNSLSNLDLVLLVACAQGTHPFLGRQFLNQGAQCVISVGDDASAQGVEDLFLFDFYDQLKIRPGTPTIAEAADSAFASAEITRKAEPSLYPPTQVINGHIYSSKLVVRVNGPGKNRVLRPRPLF